MVGKNITVDLLAAIYPFPLPTEVIRMNLEELEAAGFVTRTTDNGVWSFKSMLDRDALNDIVPQSQRRFLHARLAAAMSSGIDPKVTPPFHRTL